MYNWTPLPMVLRQENAMKKNKVSVVARSKGGFLTEYKKYKTATAMKKQIAPNGNITWEQKRENFLNRSVPQYRTNPTYRRWLAQVAWAYTNPVLHENHPE